MVRRRLFFTKQEWDALDAHTQRIYIEGLVDEFDRNQQDGGGGGGGGMRSAHNIPLSEFAKAGANVRRI